MTWMGETVAGNEAAPGLVLLFRQEPPRLLGPRLLEYLGLEALPLTLAAHGVDGLMAAAGFRRREDGRGVWEREGRALMVGEETLEDGGRLVWVVPLPWTGERVAERVRAEQSGA